MSKPYTPREYQDMIRDHILDVPRCAIFGGMGIGKTVSTLTAVNIAQLEDDAPALVLAPKRVARDTWAEEARKWDHLKHMDIMPILGTKKERLAAMRYDRPVYTINYENLPWLIDHFGDRWPFRTVVADEFTRLKSLRLSYRKSSTGKEFLAGQGGIRARSLGRIAHTKIKRFIGLTGTPAPNGLKDLWGQVWFLDAGQRLGRTYTAFSERWFRTGYNGYGLEMLPGAQEQIHEAIRDLCLTIRAEDWFDLTTPRVNNVYVDLPPKARVIYKELERTMFAEIESHDVEVFNAAALTNKCLQLANGAVYIEGKNWKQVHDEKIEALESIQEETNGEQLFVVYNFRSDLERLRKAFPKAVLLTDDDGLRKFKSGDARMGLGHAKSIGHGYDGLQKHCWNIVFFGHDWNLEEYQQVIERIGPTRQAQAGFTDRQVVVHHIIARNTVDEVVMLRRDSKREVQDLLMEAMKRQRGKK